MKPYLKVFLAVVYLVTTLEDKIEGQTISTQIDFEAVMSGVDDGPYDYIGSEPWDMNNDSPSLTYSSYNEYFNENYGINFSLNSLNSDEAPSIVQTGGNPGYAFTYPNCANTGGDISAPEGQPNSFQGLGNYFLTTSQINTIPPDLFIDYDISRIECSQASGFVLDTDGCESWFVEVFSPNSSDPSAVITLCSPHHVDPTIVDMNCSVTYSCSPIENCNTIRIGNGLPQPLASTSGDGLATLWSVDLSDQNQIIDYIKFSYIGEGLPGLAFDNFSFCSLQPETCGEVIDQTPEFTCPNAYSYTFQFQNNTEEEVTSVVLNGITPDGITLSSQFFNFYQDPIQPGESSDMVETEIQLDTPLEEAQEVCFDVIYLTDGEQCCHYEHCVLLEPVDPCEFLRIEPTETAENCCYEINAINEYCADFFTGIQMEVQTEGIVFSSFNENNNWIATPNEEMTTIFWSMEEGNLPLGSLPPILFCLGGISSASQIPQTVVVSWIAVDPATGEEISYCEETLEFFCEPCLMLEGSVECTDEETYIYDFSITNNSDHIASMIVFEVHTPNVILDPPFITTTINPGDSYSDVITITSEDGNPLPANTEVEFKAILYDAEGWCCHLDDITLVLPDCAPLLCDCPSQAEFTQQVQESFSTTFNCLNNQVQLLANSLGPCDEIQWTLVPVGGGGPQTMITPGNVPAQFDFTPGTVYQVAMSAQTFDANGDLCFSGNATSFGAISNDCIEEIGPRVDIAYSNHTLSIFPVPATTAVKLVVPTTGRYEWSIFNANGQQMNRSAGHLDQGQPVSLDITNYSDGVFFVRLRHENGEVFQGRFVKVE